MNENLELKLLDLARRKFGELNPNEENLFTLAQKRFRNLSAAEYELFRRIANNESVDYRTEFEKNQEESDLKNASNWGEERTLQADRIQWLCKNLEVCQLCSSQGIDISGAKIKNSLNLSFAEISIPLRFFQCYFTEALLLQQTKLKRLDLSGTYITSSKVSTLSSEPLTDTSIDAREINVIGSILLSNKFKVEGRVSLYGATIGGTLDCSKGTFTNKDGDTLFAQGVNVKGDILLSNEFNATGRVSLYGVTIGGTLDCSKGTFTNKDGDTLFAQGVNVKGDILLKNEFNATGRVSLSGANIGGNLDCDKGTFTNKDGDALFAQGVTVKGDILLKNEFNATGSVSLSGANIGGNLDCDKGKFTNKDGDALVAKRVKVQGDILLGNEFEAKGRVSLYGATIGGNLDCDKGKFTNKDGDALYAEVIKVQGNIFLRNEFNAIGRVSLSGAIIGDTLDCHKGKFTNENKDALYAESVNVKNDVYLSNEFEAKGRVSLPSATVGGNLDCNEGIFTNKDGDALLAQNVNVKGNILLCNEFKAIGTVNLSGTRVEKTLSIDKIKLPEETEKMVLNLQFAYFQTLEYADNSLPNLENPENPECSSFVLKLNGLVYDALGGDSLTREFKQHLKWLKLQPKKSFTSQPYEQLAKVLRVSGNTDEAIRVLIGKEDEQLRSGNLKWYSKFWKRIIGVTIAYGYRPQKAFVFAIGIIILGSCIFNIGSQNGLITSTSNDCKLTTTQQSETKCPDYPRFNPLIYSLDIFLPIIDLRLKTSWLPNANTGIQDGLFHIKSGAWLRYYLFIHIISGWVLTTLWVAGFSGIVRNNNK